MESQTKKDRQCTIYLLPCLVKFHGKLYQQAEVWLYIRYAHAHEHSLVNSPSCWIPSNRDKETIS